MKHWYNFRNGGMVPRLMRNEGGNTPNVQTGIPQGGYARPAWDTYLAGTNPYGYDYSQFQTVNYKPSNYTFKDYYTPPVVTETTPADDNTTTTPVDTYTGPVDDAGVPAPFLGVDPYDPEGDDNFLTQDEQAVLTQTIADEFDSIDTYDPTKTFEEQLSDEDYAAWSQTDATADNYMSMSNPAVEAADTLYNNNQQIYGEPTGNNVTSLVTGNVTGLSDAGIAELQNAPDDQTWVQGDSPVEELINQQVADWQDQAPPQPIILTPTPEPTIDTSTFETHTPTDTSSTDTWSGDSHPAFDVTPEESAAAAGFDMNDPSTWKDPNEDKGIVQSFTDSAKDIVTGGGSDGVGNFGVVGDVLGGIGDALGLTDYAGQAEAKAAEEAAAAKAAEEAAAAQAQAEAEARAKAEADAAVAAAVEAQRQAEIRAQQEAAAKAAQEAAAAKAAQEEAARKAQEEADRKANEARANADMDQVRAAQDRLAAGEIDFATYLQEAGLRDAYNQNLGISAGSPSENLGVMFGTAPAGTPGYVASDGPVNTKTGQHTVENEPDGKTAAEEYKAAKAKVNDNDDPHMTHDEIIEHHKSLQEAETKLIQSDLSDDEFWDAYDDDDGGGGSDDGGGSSAGGATVICTALRDLGLIDRRTWQNAERWAALRTDAPTYYGYLHWATPIAEGMREGKHGFFRWAGVYWAHQMSYEITKGREGKRSVVGWLACRIGSVVSKLVGLTLGGNYAKSTRT